MKENSAAQALEGLVLKEKWTVLEKLKPSKISTGGFFSCCYLVTDGKRKAFLKALDFVSFFQLSGSNGRILDIVNEMTDAYLYERDLLLLCKEKRLSKVSVILDEGEENIEGFVIPNVPYFIFELADGGDVRNKLHLSQEIDLLWKLRSLHNIAVGLKQLHGINISHQDLKPSNILVFDEQRICKIGDIGRSLCKNIVSPHEDCDFAGDFNYAPPEILYGHQEADWTKRVYSTDAYLFGSMIVFYFSGVNMTTLLGSFLDEQLHWTRWTGTYSGVLPYVLDTYEKAIESFENDLPNDKLKKELKPIVSQLCYPNPSLRGHPKTIINGKNQYNLERYVSIFARLVKMAEFQMFN